MFISNYYPAVYYPQSYFAPLGAEIVNIIRTISMTMYVRESAAIAGYVRSIINLEGFI